MTKLNIECLRDAWLAVSIMMLMMIVTTNLWFVIPAYIAIGLSIRYNYLFTDAFGGSLEEHF